MNEGRREKKMKKKGTEEENEFRIDRRRNKGRERKEGNKYREENGRMKREEERKIARKQRRDGKRGKWGELKSNFTYL